MPAHSFIRTSLFKFYDYSFFRQFKSTKECIDGSFREFSVKWPLAKRSGFIKNALATYGRLRSQELRSGGGGASRSRLRSAASRDTFSTSDPLCSSASQSSPLPYELLQQGVGILLEFPEDRLLATVVQTLVQCISDAEWTMPLDQQHGVGTVDSVVLDALNTVSSAVLAHRVGTATLGLAIACRLVRSCGLAYREAVVRFHARTGSAALSSHHLEPSLGARDLLADSSPMTAAVSPHTVAWNDYNYNNNPNTATPAPSSPSSAHQRRFSLAAALSSPVHLPLPAAAVIRLCGEAIARSGWSASGAPPSPASALPAQQKDLGDVADVADRSAALDLPPALSANSLAEVLSSLLLCELDLPHGCGCLAEQCTSTHSVSSVALQLSSMLLQSLQITPAYLRTDHQNHQNHQSDEAEQREAKPLVVGHQERQQRRDSGQVGRSLLLEVKLLYSLYESFGICVLRVRHRFGSARTPCDEIVSDRACRAMRRTSKEPHNLQNGLDQHLRDVLQVGDHVAAVTKFVLSEASPGASSGVSLATCCGLLEVVSRIVDALNRSTPQRYVRYAATHEEVLGLLLSAIQSFVAAPSGSPSELPDVRAGVAVLLAMSRLGDVALSVAEQYGILDAVATSFTIAEAKATEASTLIPEIASKRGEEPPWQQEVLQPREVLVLATAISRAGRADGKLWTALVSAIMRCAGQFTANEAAFIASALTRIGRLEQRVYNALLAGAWLHKIALGEVANHLPAVVSSAFCGAGRSDPSLCIALSSWLAFHGTDRGSEGVSVVHSTTDLSTSSTACPAKRFEFRHIVPVISGLSRARWADVGFSAVAVALVGLMDAQNAKLFDSVAENQLFALLGAYITVCYGFGEVLAANSTAYCVQEYFQGIWGGRNGAVTGHSSALLRRHIEAFYRGVIQACVVKAVYLDENDIPLLLSLAHSIAVYCVMALQGPSESDGVASLSSNGVHDEHWAACIHRFFDYLAGVFSSITSSDLTVADSERLLHITDLMTSQPERGSSVGLPREPFVSTKTLGRLRRVSALRKAESKGGEMDGLHVSLATTVCTAICRHSRFKGEVIDNGVCLTPSCGVSDSSGPDAGGLISDDAVYRDFLSSVSAIFSSAKSERNTVKALDTLLGAADAVLQRAFRQVPSFKVDLILLSGRSVLTVPCTAPQIDENRIIFDVSSSSSSVKTTSQNACPVSFTGFTLSRLYVRATAMPPPYCMVLLRSSVIKKVSASDAQLNAVVLISAAHVVASFMLRVNAADDTAESTIDSRVCFARESSVAPLLASLLESQDSFILQ